MKGRKLLIKIRPVKEKEKRLPKFTRTFARRGAKVT